jgi:hypothetical protein
MGARYRCLLVMNDDLYNPLNRNGDFNPDVEVLHFSKEQAEAVAILMANTSGIELLVAEE